MAEGNEDIEGNFNLQKEELEALSAIYGDDFLLEQDYDEDFVSQDKDSSWLQGTPGLPTFSISIRPECEESESGNLKTHFSSLEEARLIISFQAGYPTSSPPIYQLSIPWLRGGQKQIIADALEELYLENLGESIVYIWVEKLRELLREQALKRITDEYESRMKRNQAEVDPSSPGSNNAVSIEMGLSSPSEGNEKLIEGFSQSLYFSHSGENAVSDDSCGSHSKRDENQQQRNSLGNKIEIGTGAPLTDRKSTFQAHVAPISEVNDVRTVLDELYKNKKIASATHNMYAYRIQKGDSKTWLQDCDDDGETHAGSRLLHLLQILDCKNVLVVVSRWYGGIQLHGDRFKHINNVARQALSQFGFLSDTDGKKGEDLKNKKSTSR